MSMKIKLTRFKSHLSLSEEKITSNDQINSTNEEIKSWEVFDAKPFFFEDGYSIVREKVYPLDYQHGLYQLSELLEVAKWWEESEFNHPLSSRKRSISDMFFFDIETTGLSGGSGTFIFLLGYARVLADRVVVRQHFLPGPSHEVALYQGFLTEIGEPKELLLHSYNGKAFDWPQVRTRHTFVRDQVQSLPKFGHFDLLHASRRFWKDLLPSCRLSIVEKEILQINRQGDTPGSLAPLLYFDYLKEKNPTIIAGILKHNEIDVLSLITLYIHLSKKILGKTTNTLKETYEIARWFEKEKETNKAILLYKEVVNRPSSAQNEALLALGLLLKKQKQINEALDCFQQLAKKEGSLSVQACIELAKINEHHFKDFEKAYYFTKLAYQRQKQITRLVKEKNVLEQLKQRLERLEKKR